MDKYKNGAPAGGIATTWIKAQASNLNGQCVELGALTGGGVAMRNSTDPTGPALIFTDAEMRAFLTGACAGEFDHLISQ
ncbi:DUF397 domain-containing protein [Kitasatospora sp. NPDC050463]|uniref:DUF397 domain-containing protein n=1 Tax=Kitasatospora sp. NPDC050463 TaxID=3155786 RepID=UPI0033EB8D1B